jgi:hypothetical protein
MKKMATSTKSTKKRKTRIYAPAIKPGTYGEYLWNLPDEEIDRMLEEAGFDVKEIKRILAQGGGVIPWPNAKNKSIEEKT